MRINLAPVKFSGKELLEKVISALSKAFNAEVNEIELDIDPASAYSQDRKQYFSTKLLAEAIKKTDEIEGNVMLLTDNDIYVPVFTFLFGEAQLEGRHSVVSVFRLHEEFYSGRSDDKLLFERTMKEVLHELGHNFGLIHCSNWDCVMHTSRSVEEIDVKGENYCSECALNIKEANYNPSWQL